MSQVRSNLGELKGQQKNAVDSGNSLIIHLEDSFGRFQEEQLSMQNQMKKEFSIQVEKQEIIQKLGQEQLRNALRARNLSQNVQTGFRKAEDLFSAHQKLIGDTRLSQNTMDSFVNSQLPCSSVDFGSQSQLPRSLIDSGSQPLPQMHHPMIPSVDRASKNMDVFPGVAAGSGGFADRRFASTSVSDSPQPVPCVDEFNASSNYHPSSSPVSHQFSHSVPCFDGFVSDSKGHFSAAPGIPQFGQSVPPRPVPPAMRSHEEQMQNPMPSMNMNNSPTGPSPVKLVHPPEFSATPYQRWKKEVSYWLDLYAFVPESQIISSL